MANKSKIEWTDSTWNPSTGCTKLSPGCDNCYAESIANRFRSQFVAYRNGFDLTLHDHRLDQPKRWTKPRMIFVNSMSDLFHEDMPKAFIDKVFDVMIETDRHFYQVLTKRSSLMRNYVNRRFSGSKVPKHIWLGVSVENRATKSRLDHLRQTNAEVRFVSFEPLLGDLQKPNLTDIDWVIVGGESGPKAREMKPEWVRSIRDQCIELNRSKHTVSFFFKQWGGRNKKKNGRLLDGIYWNQMPAAYGIRQRISYAED